MEDRSGGRTAAFDRSMNKWSLRIRLDDERKWFLTVAVNADGSLDTFCLDLETADDSHYKFKDESGVRKSIYAPGDEDKYLAECLIRYVGQYGGESLPNKIMPYITAQYHD